MKQYIVDAEKISFTDSLYFNPFISQTLAPPEKKSDKIITPQAVAIFKGRGFPVDKKA